MKRILAVLSVTMLFGCSSLKEVKLPPPEVVEQRSDKVLAEIERLKAEFDAAYAKLMEEGGDKDKVLEIYSLLFTINEQLKLFGVQGTDR